MYAPSEDFPISERLVGLSEEIAIHELLTATRVQVKNLKTVVNASGAGSWIELQERLGRITELAPQLLTFIVRMLGKAMGEALSISSRRDRRSEAWGTPSSSFWPFFSQFHPGL